MEQRRYETNTVRTPETVQQTTDRTAIRTSRRKKISSGEKFLFTLFAVALVVFSSMILHTNAQIHNTNKEVQLINQEIEKTTKENTELSIQVSEKSTYEVIWKKAEELGLDLNEKNVKVVSER